MEDKSDDEAASPSLLSVENHTATGSFIALGSTTVTGSLMRTIDRVGPRDSNTTIYELFKIFAADP
jgi:hypothetical protein